MISFIVQLIIFGVLTPLAILARRPGTGEESGVCDEVRPWD